jgi:tRNA1(Val) A37 N6-methylase TrmN6
LSLFNAERRHEKQFNIQTAEFIKSSSSQYFHYQGASYHVLFRLFESLDPLTKEFHFIDIGSGKGRAVFVAEYCGFTILTGIELNKNLVKDAKQNLTTFSLKKKD